MLKVCSRCGEQVDPDNPAWKDIPGIGWSHHCDVPPVSIGHFRAIPVSEFRATAFKASQEAIVHHMNHLHRLEFVLAEVIQAVCYETNSDTIYCVQCGGHYPKHESECVVGKAVRAVNEIFATH